MNGAFYSIKKSRVIIAGNSPLTDKMFTVDVDQVIVNEQLPCFTKAFQMMFCSYHLHNVDNPVELAAPLTFLQRYAFSMHAHTAFLFVNTQHSNLATPLQLITL